MELAPAVSHRDSAFAALFLSPVCRHSPFSKRIYPKKFLGTAGTEYIDDIILSLTRVCGIDKLWTFRTKYLFHTSLQQRVKDEMLPWSRNSLSVFSYIPMQSWSMVDTEINRINLASKWVSCIYEWAAQKLSSCSVGMEDTLCFTETIYSCKWKMGIGYLSLVPEPKMEASKQDTPQPLNALKSTKINLLDYLFYFLFFFLIPFPKLMFFEILIKIMV